jgi:hypothetical protein
MTFGVSAIAADLEPTDVGALDLSFADVEHERDAAVVIRCAVVHAQIAGHINSHEHVSA